MTALSIQPTYPIFTDIDGQPLENGYVWIGTANLDPQSNPINVYWDDALTQLAAQPIRTRGGYPVNAGTPARLYVNSDYSIRVTNKNGAAIYNAPEATERISSAIISQIDSSQVSYTPAGTGAVATTVQSKLLETVSVKDFGAASSASAAVNTAAFQAAFSSGSASVYVPSGTYAINNSLQMADDQTLYGDGAQSVLSFASNNSADNRRLKIGSNCRVDNLRVTETGVTGRNGVYGLVFGEGKSNIVVSRVVSDNSSSTGMFFINCSNVLVENSFVKSTKADGIHFQRGSSNVIVRGCVIDATEDDGISFVSHGYTTYGNVKDCIAENNIITSTAIVGSGVAVIGALDVIVSGNIIKNTQLVGIRITPASFAGEGDTVGGRITVTDNQIYNPGVGSVGERGGIYIDGNRYVLVKNNHIYNAPTYGIALSNAWIDVDISGNQIVKCYEGVIAISQSLTNYYLQLWTKTELTDGQSLAYVSGHNTSIKNNTIRSMQTNGIALVGQIGQYLQSVNVKNNDFYRLKVSSAGSGYNIYAIYVDRLSVQMNEAHGNVNALGDPYWYVASCTNLDGVDDTNVPRSIGLRPDGSTFIGQSRHYVNGSAPASGTYNLGDVVWNWNPASGVLAWVCVSAGSPGTWSAINVN